MNGFIVGFGPETNEYVVNGVRYIAESRFEPVAFNHMEENCRLDQRLKKYLTASLTDLPLPDEGDMMEAEYVCSAAGKEVKHAAEEEEK